MSGGFCPFCGAAAAADARFCAKCGRAMSAAPSTPGAQSSGESTVFELRPLVVRTMLELLLCVVTLGVGFVCLWIARMGRRYIVTTQRIETRTGVLTRRRESLDLFRVEDFEVIEPLYLRMRGAGHLKLWSMDKDEPVLVLEAIADVQTVYEKLRELTRAERGRNQVRVVDTG